MISGMIAGMSVATKATVVMVMRAAAYINVGVISHIAYCQRKERKASELEQEKKAICAITGGLYEEENNR